MLLGISTLLSWLVAEWAWASFLRPSPPPRALFFSENPWQLDPRGFTRYKPNATVRLAAVFGKKIEYDVTFSTNDHGFVDSERYAVSSTDHPVQSIAIVGDSFTAGFHAGTPWVPTLRAEPGFDATSQRLFNFGVSGTGLRNFAQLLRAYSQDLALDVILIVAITSDFDRPLWRPATVDDRIFLCHMDWSESQCRERNTEIFVLPHNATKEEILKLAEEKYAQRDARPWKRLKESLAAWLARRLLKRKNAPVGDGSDALTSIRRTFPNAEIQAAPRPTVERGSLHEIPRSTRKRRASGIAYISGWDVCGLSSEDFFPNDSHPNASGYRKIKDCASQALALQRGDHGPNL